LCIAVLNLALAPLALSAAARAHLTVEDIMRAIAFDKGVKDIKQIELDHGIWKIEGRDATGHKIEIEVDAQSGEIVKIKRN
jgi:uncharacterized membrane protein YkoI